MDEQIRSKRQDEIETRSAELLDEACQARGEPMVRRLTPGEIQELRRDMAEASAWAKVELSKRRKLKSRQFKS